jgi:hypothetical protein
MRQFVWLAALAIILPTATLATTPEVAVLDGTSWKIEVEPDAMAKRTGETQFKETVTFADGNVSLSAPRVGFGASPYSVSITDKKDWTFKAERVSAGEGRSVLTGTVRGDNVDGKLIWTKNDGVVMTYTFQGSKLD